MAAPYTFENTLRVHDQSVVDWLRGMHVDYGIGNDLFKYDAAKNDVPVLVVMATPDRVVAEIIQQLVLQNWITDAEASRLQDPVTGTRIEQIPLPVVSLTRGEPEPDPEIRRVPGLLHAPKGMADPRTGKPYTYQFPANYRTPYSATFWCNKRYTEAFMREWLYSQFGGLGAGDTEMFLPVTHDLPFGVMRQSFKFQGTRDLSFLEGDSPRTLRYEATFSLRTWIIKAPVDSFAGVPL